MKSIGLEPSIFFFMFSAIFLVACNEECDIKNCGNNGLWDPNQCACNCFGGYYGEFCELYTPEYSMHADVSADGSAPYSFDPEDLDIETIDNTQDTIFIEGYSEGAAGEDDDQYLYFAIVLDDVFALSLPATFQISPLYLPGTSWCSFRDPTLDLLPYTPLINSSGSITLTSFQYGGVVSGTFDADLFSGASTVNVTGVFSGLD